MLLKQSHVVILIETTEGNKFGCYVSKEIAEVGKYVADSNAFVFKLEGGNIEKYPVIDMKNAIKICNAKDSNLLAIGNGDIIVKKKELKNNCSCKQVSFDYQGKKNVLIGRTGEFEVKSVVVLGTISDDELMEFMKDIVN